MFKKRLTAKILFFLVFSDILETVTHFCFKKSALLNEDFLVHNFGDILVFLGSTFSSYFLWLGLISVALTFVVWSTILSKIDLSVAVPVCSFSYITIPLVSIFFLHEKINAMRWVGISLILVGVIFVSLSSKEKEVLPP